LLSSQVYRVPVVTAPGSEDSRTQDARIIYRVLPSELKGIDSKSFIERRGARLNCVMDGFNCVMDGFNCVMDGFNCVMDGFNCVMDGFNCVMDGFNCMMYGFNCMMDGFNWFAACVRLVSRWCVKR